MNKIAEYSGNLLNHVETLYRPGERGIAMRMVQALGCSISDTGFMGDGNESFLAVHSNPDDPDTRNNAFFMSPMRPEQLALEQRLHRLAAQDTAFAAELEDYRQIARTKPFGVSHFALRYASGDAVAQAAERLGSSLGTELGDRLHVRVFEPGASGATGPRVVQGFVYQDVIVSGSFLYGQLIELQSQSVLSA